MKEYDEMGTREYWDRRDANQAKDDAVAERLAPVTAKAAWHTEYAALLKDSSERNLTSAEQNRMKALEFQIACMG